MYYSKMTGNYWEDQLSEVDWKLMWIVFISLIVSVLLFHLWGILIWWGILVLLDWFY